MDPQKTAVVLVEFQNDFTSEGGALHGAVKDSMAATDMITHTQEAVAAARAAGATIIHAPIQFAEGYGEITSHPYGILKGVVDTNAFVKGSWGADFVAEVSPQPGDIVLEG
ncbi:MAG TPA: isochorismatase family protein, partial [Ideonella sp.]|nr:isochorismatase family protein [Ideonella sp.]